MFMLIRLTLIDILILQFGAVQFSFLFIPEMLMVIIVGPLIGSVVLIVGTILVSFIKDVPISILIGLISIDFLKAFVYGTLLYKKPKTLLKIFIASSIISIVLYILLYIFAGIFWLHVVVGQTYLINYIPHVVVGQTYSINYMSHMIFYVTVRILIKTVVIYNICKGLESFFNTIDKQ
jgi:hypothetical protein